MVPEIVQWPNQRKSGLNRSDPLPSIGVSGV